MPHRYVDAILKYLSARDYQPLKPRQLARQMGVAEEDYGSFRQAVKQLRDNGRVIMGDRNALTLPAMGRRVVGFFSAHPRGFGFVVPEQPNAHGDLFIPGDQTGQAMHGDLVAAQVQKGRRDGQQVFSGKIVEIIRRGENRFVGTLHKVEENWFVLPDGTGMTRPIVIRDIGAAGPGVGSKVVAEVIEYPKAGDLPVGVLVETFGQSGQLAVETRAVIRAHGLEEEFSAEAQADARAAIAAFDSDQTAGREDFTGETIITIDPPDARDFDDAISLRRDGDGAVTLGVHIADVSHFVAEGSALDAEARRRGTSVYFPRRVLPMLPKILSNGVCSLQEGQRRYCKSVLITYDSEGEVRSRRLAEMVIASAKRLTYQQAQQIIDGKTGGYDEKVVALLGDLHALARKIEARRRRAGMLHLDLPSVELVFDKHEKVVDAVPEDDAYTHTMIEMFMVEANEAVAGTFDRLDRPILRRIHPDPDPADSKLLASFVRAAGHKIPRDLSRKDLQGLLEAVKGKPESHAVNLAVLKTFQQAEYSPMRVGHFALASEHYCHFTSPIRRYPDLTVHRLIRDYCRGAMGARPPEDLSELARLGGECTAAEKRAEAAEEEVREVLLLQMLEGKVGEDFDGVITGVANFGIFVELRRYLIDGLIRMPDLGDDWWEVQARYGQIRGERSGKTYRIGDVLNVRIVGVDVARRQLNLVLQEATEEVSAAGLAKGKRARGRRRSDKKAKRGKRG